MLDDAGQLPAGVAVGDEVDADADVCPYCGYEFPKQKSYVPWVAILFVLLMLAFLVF